ncbi:unnamed protein product [Rotaria magnacalcarata]|uniref:Uncharacterized protein n=1 Tax=Rotaria magnacalcarata TaxID=392030 RepID=A0A819WM14_9BILA|nr:unnamed protein product [Rotaria magnacalcarata]CAF4126785.1 unnamed protein product [Rotaria magnacalcarata]
MPVQCYICLQYNHVAKYFKTKQQVCAKCGDNHRIEQCTAANDAIKCNNCKEQEKRMLNLINQYSSTNSPTITTPLLHDANVFPSLPNMYQRQQGHHYNDIFDELINLLSTKMEKNHSKKQPNDYLNHFNRRLKKSNKLFHQLKL